MGSEQFARWSGAAVGLLSSLVVAAVLWGQFQARLDATEKALSDHRLQASHSASGERIARVEQQLIAVNQSVERMERAMDRLAVELAAERKRTSP